MGVPAHKSEVLITTIVAVPNTATSFMPGRHVSRCRSFNVSSVGCRCAIEPCSRVVAMTISGLTQFSSCLSDS